MPLLEWMYYPPPCIPKFEIIFCSKMLELYPFWSNLKKHIEWSCVKVQELVLSDNPQSMRCELLPHEILDQNLWNWLRFSWWWWVMKSILVTGSTLWGIGPSSFCLFRFFPLRFFENLLLFKTLVEGNTLAQSSLLLCFNKLWSHGFTDDEPTFGLFFSSPWPLQRQPPHSFTTCPPHLCFISCFALYFDGCPAFSSMSPCSFTGCIHDSVCVIWRGVYVCVCVSSCTSVGCICLPQGGATVVFQL